MSRCPNCREQQSKLRCFFLSNMDHMFCRKCGIKLKASRLPNTIVGAIGGGVGTYSGVQLAYSPYSLLWWGILICLILVLYY